MNLTHAALSVAGGWGQVEVSVPGRSSWALSAVGPPEPVEDSREVRVQHTGEQKPETA